MTDLIIGVALNHPLPTLFDYLCPAALQPQLGQLVQVPFGKRQLIGLIASISQKSTLPLERLRPIDELCLAYKCLAPSWHALIEFASKYYQRPFGAVALPALPKNIRLVAQWKKRPPLDISEIRAKEYPALSQTLDTSHQPNALSAECVNVSPADSCPPSLNEEQATALHCIEQAKGFLPFVLHGITGSGKTEVYLRALAQRLEHEPTAQALVLVPEINLTPQFEALFRKRFAHWPASSIVTLHSNLTETQRTQHWLAAHNGSARIVLGTRLSVLASFTRLTIIIVDEEHDAAYKQQEGVRYSARDLALWRAKQLNIPIVLGSATPSLETWRQLQRHRYTHLTLTKRAVTNAILPTVRLIDMEAAQRLGQKSAFEGISTPLLKALQERLTKQEQSLLFLNRRGYAPVLSCEACGWVSGCPHCASARVLHSAEHCMRCHHCGEKTRIPRVCPDCGNVDLAPLGRGTQRLEETLSQALPGARILRIDADSTRKKGSAIALFQSIANQEVDVVIGTQMIAKGHDFKRVTLVGILNADAALFSHDFRASERLFAQIMQASGRAGRTGQGEVLIQTRYPNHPLYDALMRHDYTSFANSLLAERSAAQLPPFTYQAMLRAQARTLEGALNFLSQAAERLATLPGAERVTRYDPIALSMSKVMNQHRAQLLLESASRTALQTLLSLWQPLLHSLKGVLHWSIEVDPIEF